MFRRPIVIAIVLAVCLGHAAPAAVAAGSDHQRHPAAGGARTSRLPVALGSPAEVTVVVELAGAPLGERIAQAAEEGSELSPAERRAIVEALSAEQRRVIERAQALGGRLRYSFQATYNGFSVRISRNRLGRLAALPGVVGVHLVGHSRPSNERSVPYIGAPSAWQALGLTGTGMRIGVIDTGIDYYHANFGGSGNPADFAADDGLTIGTPAFPSAKVAGGWDFVGDEYDASSDDPAAYTPQPDPDPLDCDGHGSHVAGTAAGYGVLANGSTFGGPWNSTTVGANSWLIGPGVAPQAKVYGYRVFGCAGSVADDVLIAAIERAVDDGVHVINMSLGAPFGANSEPNATAVNNASLAGVMVVVSAGNSGPGAYIHGGPAAATRALSVAAIDGGFASLPAATIDVSGVGTLINNNNGGPLPVSSAPLAVLMDGSNIALGCDAADYAGTAGKIVVVMRGECPRVDRAHHGQAAGAAAVIMVNNTSAHPPFEGPIPGVTIPFLGATGAAGVAAALIGANGTNRTLTSSGQIANPGYRSVANFSSGGPRYGDSALKPDVAAPGVSTVSTAVGTGTQGQAFSGTSMADPHAAGVAALVRQARPTWTPEQVKAAIMGTASVASSVLNAGSRDPRLVGAGVLQPRRAAATLAYVVTDPGQSSLSFGYRALNGAFSQQKRVRIFNTRNAATTFNLSSSFIGSPTGASITFSSSSVSVPAKRSADVMVTLRLTLAGVRALPSIENVQRGRVATIAGAVTATPTTSGNGFYALRVPFLLVPRGLANMVPAKTSLDFRPSKTSLNDTFTNNGVHAGSLDVYAWGADSGQNSSLGAIDIRSVGVQSLPQGGDRLVVFALNTWSKWSTASANEYDILVHTKGTADPDYLIAGIDEGWLLEGNFNGTTVAAAFDLASGALVDLWYAVAPANSGTLLLPVLASALGVTPGAPTFRYWAETYQLFDQPGWYFDVSPTSRFNPFSQPVSTGAYFLVGPGAKRTVTFTINRSSATLANQKGWLIVTHDANSGAQQAKRITLIR
jgi:minor extracellular serine protease Vpr